MARRKLEAMVAAADWELRRLQILAAAAVVAAADRQLMPLPMAALAL
jgi:hypothetical protein